MNIDQSGNIIDYIYNNSLGLTSLMQLLFVLMNEKKSRSKTCFKLNFWIRINWFERYRIVFKWRAIKQMWHNFLWQIFVWKTEKNGKNIIVYFIGSAQLLGSLTCEKAVNNLALRIPHNNNNNIKKKTRQRLPAIIHLIISSFLYHDRKNFFCFFLCKKYLNVSQ